MSKNDFFYIGRGFIQDHQGPHKTQKKLEKSLKKGGKRAQDRPLSLIHGEYPWISANISPVCGSTIGRVTGRL